MQGKKPLNIAIGRRIQQSREQAGLTQEELAERIDRSTQFISTIERGLAGPSLETVIHLCEVDPAGQGPPSGLQSAGSLRYGKALRALPCPAASG
mgnify:CR=1 FL=1